MTMIPADVLVDQFTPTGSEPPPGMALKPATVTSLTGSDIADTHVLIDGDTIPSPVLSLVGAVNEGQRVMVMFWPPQGAYIVGVIGGPTGWTAVTSFGTNWSNFGGATQQVEYRRDGNWVTLRGVATYTAGQSVSIFTLPANFRPQARENFAIDTNPQVHSVITTDPAGGVEFVAGPGAAAGYVSLSGVRFWAT